MTNLLVRTFIRNPEYTEDAHVRAAYGKLAGVTGIVCNLFLFAVKLAIGLFSRSISITADAFNNLGDIGSAVVSLIGFSLAAKLFSAFPQKIFLILKLLKNKNLS